MAEPLFVDNSLLSSVDCSTDLALRHIHGYTSIKDRAPQIAGGAAHHALDVWFHNKDKHAAMSAFEERYRDFADENVSDPEDRLSWDNTSAVLDHWFDTHGKDLIKDVEVIPGFVEVGFAYPLGVEVPIKKSRKEQTQFDPASLTQYYRDTKCEFVFCGRFDLLVRWRGHIYVWENKTTGSVSNLKNTLRWGSQLSGYLWAGKKIIAHASPFKEMNVSGVLVNAVEFRKRPSSDRKCSTHGMKYSQCGFSHLGHEFIGPLGKSPEMLVEWEKTALNLAKRYRDVLVMLSAGGKIQPRIEDVAKLRTQGQFIYGRCPNCAMSEFCLAGRPMDKVDVMLKHEPWSPFDGVIQESQSVFLAGHKVDLRQAA
jgi:hypothetical protein